MQQDHWLAVKQDAGDRRQRMNRESMVTSLKVIVASLVGAFAVQGVVAACGGNDTKPANAQGVSSCTKWEVVSVSNSDLTKGGELGSGTYAKSIYAVPSGWEPFAAVGQYAGEYALRRCVQ
jgi:hypothetical protein